jgi:hypothetical protein
LEKRKPERAKETEMDRTRIEQMKVDQGKWKETKEDGRSSEAIPGD